MKGSPSLMKCICRSVALMMVTVSAASAAGYSDSPLPGNLPPCMQPAGDASDAEFDPCLISPVFSGCIGTREALKASQRALAAEQSITGQYRALMGIKNEQSRRYVETLYELSALRKRLDRCGTAGASLPRTAIPDDITPRNIGFSR